MIRLTGIQVTFGRGTPLETQALRGLDLTVDAGAYVTLIGSNGAGKSTLLGVLTGDVRPDAGRVEIGGVDVTLGGAAARAGMVARVFQDPLAGSCAALSIEENLALAQRRGGRRSLRPALRPGDRDRFRARLAELGLGLEQRLGEPVGSLSGGQRQALALVMATLAPAKLFLLDEHTAALDPRAAGLILALTDRLVARHGLTTLMVTHSMRQALAHGQRTVMLHEGRVVLDIAGPERARLDVQDLLARFRAVHADAAASDRLLAG